MKKIIHLWKSFILKWTLICSLCMLVSFSFADNVNPYAENITLSNVKTLDNFVDLVKDKWSSLKSPQKYLELVNNIDNKVENLYKDNLDNYKLVQILKYIRFELWLIIDNLDTIIDEITNTNVQWSCSTNPAYVNAIFDNWKPTKDNTLWQNEDSTLPCYYSCKVWFYWNDCSVKDNNTSSQGDITYEQVKSSIILAWSKDVKLVAFKITAEIDNIKISDLNFTWINLNVLSNFRLLTSSNIQIPASYSSTNSVLFKKLTTMEVIPMNTSKIYYLIADVNNYIDNTKVWVTLNVNGSSISWSSWRIFSMSWNSVVWPTHTIWESKTWIVKLDNPSKDLATSALIFSVSAFGKDQIVLSWASFNNEIVWYTWATTLTVYKNSVSNSNIVGTWWITWTVKFTSNNTVDSWSTQKFIVVVNWTIDSNAKNTTWTIRLDNVEIWTINANEYENLWSFPIVESK